MLIKWMLFETKLGEMLLVFLERKVGLAVVDVGWLAGQRSSEPKAASETH